jgi:hypothetical protein
MRDEFYGRDGKFLDGDRDRHRSSVPFSDMLTNCQAVLDRTGFRDLEEYFRDLEE